jgi:hypothetical protein
VVTEALAIQVFPEDNGKDAFDTLCKLLSAALRRIEPHLDETRVRYEHGMSFHEFYRSTRPDDHGRKLTLARSIATHIALRHQPTVAVVHVDADLRWSDRDETHLCDNLRRFKKEIGTRVAAHLRVDADQLDRLLFLVPFWSIESWLYQNTQEALAICAEHHPRYRDAAETFKRWRDAPDRLDDEVHPKRQIYFGSKFNLRLAGGLPARRLEELGLSFSRALRDARASALAGYLPELRHPWARG